VKFIQAQFTKDPFWTCVIGLLLVLVALYLIGPGGQETIMTSIANVGRDPVATIQAVGAGMALVSLGVAGLFHLTPWWRHHGTGMVKGVLTALVILFVGLPLAQWGIQHRAEVPALIASHAASPASVSKGR